VSFISHEIAGSGVRRASVESAVRFMGQQASRKDAGAQRCFRSARSQIELLGTNDL
jgi:hypothetical protein